MRTGRPALPPDEVRKVYLNVRMTAAERTRVRDAAKRDHAPLSTWMRNALLNYAIPLDAALLEDDSKLHEARVALRAETREAPLSEREAVLLARLCDLMGIDDK